MDLHEDTTGPEQEEGGGKGITFCIKNSLLTQMTETTCPNIHNSPVGVDMSCSDSVNK